MHVAVTGASGFIGAALVRHLVNAGHTVTALVRATSRREHIEADVERFVTGDHADESAWPALLDGADAVIHNSADWQALREQDPTQHFRDNLLASIRLLHTSAPRPFAFMSTIAVHHDMRPRWEGRIDEDHPMRPGTLYGAYKASVETHLWADHYRTGRHTCAIRPCAVYGIDPKLERSIGYPIIERVRTERAFSKLGGGKFVHVDDVAAATVAALTQPDAAGRAYNLADCYARWADLASMAAEIAGVEAEIDRSSPPASKNVFAKDAVQSLGVMCDRGHAGIRAHLEELASLTGG